LFYCRGKNNYDACLPNYWVYSLWNLYRLLYKSTCITLEIIRRKNNPRFGKKNDLYFHTNMKANKLNPDFDFTVGEEKVLHYVIALLFFSLFLYGILDAVNRNFKKVDYQSYIFLLAIIPVIFSLRRARSNRVFIRINKRGIYHHEKLVTDWDNFQHASLAQKPKTRIVELQDNFILVVEHRKNGKILRHTIPLTNTQNRSEEDVIAAVQYFYKLSRKMAV
jgi:hypothetical protein